MKKIAFLIILSFLSINLAKADYESLDKFTFSEAEYTKILKEKILTNSKLERTFPQYKGVGKKIDQLVYNKLGVLGMQARRDYLKKSYSDFYIKYQAIDSMTSYSARKKSLAKLVLKYVLLENYTMYYRNK
ncbi:MAG: hypothetical protein PHG82_00670 [Candidatus Gracilibacteria bacterium]|nr:hypothetical protein [Candidatus Gracilibacteria bacterium]